MLRGPHRVGKIMATIEMAIILHMLWFVTMLSVVARTRRAVDRFCCSACRQEMEPQGGNPGVRRHGRITVPVYTRDFASAMSVTYSRFSLAMSGRLPWFEPQGHPRPQPRPQHGSNVSPKATLPQHGSNVSPKATLTL